MIARVCLPIITAALLTAISFPVWSEEKERPLVDKVQITFFNSSVLDELVPFYEIISGRDLVPQPHIGGATLSMSFSHPVSHEAAVTLVEHAFFAADLALVDAADGTIILCGPKTNPTILAANVYESADALPKAERVCVLSLKLKYRLPSELIPLIEKSLGKSIYSALVGDDKTKTLIITNKTSVLHGAAKLVEILDRE